MKFNLFRKTLCDLCGYPWRSLRLNKELFSISEYPIQSSILLNLSGHIPFSLRDVNR